MERKIHLKMISRLFKTLLFSGFSGSQRWFSKTILEHPILTKVLRLKVSPLFLSDPDQWTQEEYTQLVSQISTGPAFKTTALNRSPQSDDFISDYVSDKKNLNVADIGSSTGSSALYLYNQIKDKCTTFKIYDKYNHLLVQRTWFGWKIYNSDRECVYIKFPGILLFVWPLKIRSSAKTKTSEISFTDPEISRHNLTLENFDIFTSQFKTQPDLIRCANVLNLSYFTPEEIKAALANLHQNLTSEGLLFIIHNKQKSEYLLGLQKIKNGFQVIHRNGHELEILVSNDQIKLSG